MISLSNLLKNSYVLKMESEKRVISFNDRFKPMSVPEVQVEFKATEEEVTEAEFAHREEVIDGFLAGIGAQQVEIQQGPNTEEIINKAKQEAEEIIAKAKFEAQTITDNARRQADILFENMKRDGYLEGVKLAEQENAEHATSLEAEYQQKTNELEVSYKERFDTMENDIVDAIIQVFNKVFGIQFDNKKQILLHLVQNTLLDVEACKEFHIRVSQANCKFMESHIGELKERIGNDIQVDVTGDITLADTICIIETESGVYNCGIDMELSNLEKDIRSLCR